MDEQHAGAETRTSQHLGIRLPQQLLQAIDHQARTDGEPRSVVVRRLLRSALDEQRATSR
jgi:metal-responsive CopG/Arc/MetJ family transcriptional regulator